MDAGASALSRMNGDMSFLSSLSPLSSLGAFGAFTVRRFVFFARRCRSLVADGHAARDVHVGPEAHAVHAGHCRSPSFSPA